MVGNVFARAFPWPAFQVVAGRAQPMEYRKNGRLMRDARRIAGSCRGIARAGYAGGRRSPTPRELCGAVTGNGVVGTACVMKDTEFEKLQNWGVMLTSW